MRSGCYWSTPMNSPTAGESAYHSTRCSSAGSTSMPISSTSPGSSLAPTGTSSSPSPSFERSLAVPTTTAWSRGGARGGRSWPVHARGGRSRGDHERSLGGHEEVMKRSWEIMGDHGRSPCPIDPIIDPIDPIIDAEKLPPPICSPVSFCFRHTNRAKPHIATYSPERIHTSNTTLLIHAVSKKSY